MRGRALGGALLVAGTSIGAGMLALPILTSLGGFLPAVVLYILCWAVMAVTGLLFVEISLWLEGEPNIVSMAAKVLGLPGRIIAWLLYLYLFYSLTVAYLAGGGGLLVDWADLGVPSWVSTALFVLIFAPAVYLGAGVIDRVNGLLMGGLIASYALLLVIAAPHVHLENLTRVDWGSSLFALPVIVTSFGFQGLVPSLTAYLHRDPRKITFAIIVGSAIPLVCYILWEWLFLGVVPFAESGGLLEALRNGETAIPPLRRITDTPWLFYAGQFFAFFALVSSFLGVSLGLRDFLADGLRIRKSSLNRFWLCVVIFVPAYILALTNPRIFLLALQYGGGIGVALLLVLLPALLVWVGRYHKGFDSSRFRVAGGRWTLILVALFVLLLLISEISPSPRF